MDIKKLAVMVHENAVKHFWWPENKMERSVPEMLCLIHSEVSEALEAYRNSTSRVEGYDWKAHFAEELADIAIRILDMCEGRGIKLPRNLVYAIGDEPVIEQLMDIHVWISNAYLTFALEVQNYNILNALGCVQKLCDSCGIDLEAAILAKHEINKTRTYRHGNKAC